MKIINDCTSHRCSSLFRRITASLFGVFAIIAFSSLRVAAALPPSTSSAELAKCVEILRQAGAPPAVLTRFEDDMRQESAAATATREGCLRQQSPSELARLVENLRYDFPYVLGVDSRAQPGVPKGEIFDFMLDHSLIFPGTTRKITVYVPAEYVADKPASVYVGLDGLLFEAPTVFDNLIYKHEMPVTIAIGVAPGEVHSAVPSHDPRYNRSFEFDSLNDNLVRFLLDEVLPEVERHKTLAGLPIRLSNDPNDRAAGGMSTGGIGAFNLAWESPGAFRRVFTASGTFVGMRGGDRDPVLVRKTEPKPIRIFMQDGSRDGLDSVLGEVGDWWMSNQAMQRALEFAGYQVEHVWGEGTHASKQGTVVFPDAMRWLWKDWPQPIKAGESQNTFLKDILRRGETWQAVTGVYHSASALASDHHGAVFFLDATSGRTWRVTANGQASEFPAVGKAYTAMAFGPDGRAYVTEAGEERIAAYTAEGTSSTIAKGIRGSHLVVNHSGITYVTEPGASDNTGRVWLLKPNGERIQLDSGLNHPTGIALSPDGLWLAVAENKTHWGYSYRVQPDGTVQEKQRFYWFHVSDETDDSGAGAWAMDRDGRLYASTHMGVQVFDSSGRVRAILPVPGGEVTGLAFGGPAFDTLYVSCADHKLYRRQLKVLGSLPWAAPIKLPSGGAG